MIYAIVIAVIIVLLLIYFDVPRNSTFSKQQKKIHNSELVKTLLNLDEKSLNELFQLYKEHFGAGAARYARQTYQKWKAGNVRPNRQTYERFLVHLPKVMSYDLKCEVLRRLMEEYCARKDYQITVFADDWEKTLTPLVREIIDKPYTAELPAPVERRLEWLADGEMQLAQNILRKSQVEEVKIAVSMLRAEFKNIERLLAETKGKTNVTHEMKFPYGSIALKIKKR